MADIEVLQREVRQLQVEIGRVYERLAVLETPRVTVKSGAMPDVMKRHHVSISEAAVLVGVSRRTIYHWLKTGKIVRENVASGRGRIVTDSLYR